MIKKHCDLCDKTAIATLDVRSDQTTPIVKDVCQQHLAEYKKVMRVFLGHELKDVAVEKEAKP